MRHRSLLLLVLFLLLLPELVAQNIEDAVTRLGNLRQEKLQITGGVNFNGQAYAASGINARRDDFQWSARANLALSFAGFSAPFSFTFSDANQQFNLPSYTFAGISPRYKWATLHAGDRSMNFSKYTFGGISFRGAGFEMAPGKWYAGGFYGRLNRAVASDLNAVQSLNGIYDRTGYGFKVGYNDQKFSYNLILFGAADSETPSVELPGTVPLTPVNNNVVSLQGRQLIGKKVTLQIEGAHSVLNLDRTAPELATTERDLSNRLFGLIMPTESVLTGQAGKAGIFYAGKGFGIQSGYERITRGFRTLGALFFNNDTENLTAGFNSSLLKNKLTYFINGGLERTNLDAQDSEQTNRLIASVNFSYRPDENWMSNLGFSNFRNDTKLRAQTDPTVFVDSIFLAQVTRSTNLLITRRLGSENAPAMLSFNAAHQRANNIIEEEVDRQSNTRFSNLQLSYGAGSAEHGLQYNLGLGANFTNLATFSTTAVSPSASVTKRFFNNALSANLRTALSFVSQRNAAGNQVFNLSLGGNWRMTNGHTVNFGLTHLNRFGDSQPERNFSEWYLRMGYGYRFGGSIGFGNTGNIPLPGPNR